MHQFTKDMGRWYFFLLSTWFNSFMEKMEARALFLSVQNILWFIKELYMEAYFSH